MKLSEAVAGYCSFCFGGDVKSGFKFLQSIDKPSGAIRKFTEKVRNRFFVDRPKKRFNTGIPWVREVLSAYCDYYIEVMARNIAPAAAEKKLFDTLKHLVPGNPGDIDTLEQLLAERFTSIGWFFLGGITQPYRGPYIYENRVCETFSIELPLGTREIRVFFMDNFHSLSWLNFATFGKYGTGGWAKSDGLYCVRKAYDPLSEKFLVSYLKHEAQHFDDYARFPFLVDGHQAILEFRAKLVELIYASSDNTFRKFIKEAKNDKQFPHLQASCMIVEELATAFHVSVEEIGKLDLPLSEIQKQAAAIFIRNTEELKKGRICQKKNSR